MAQQLSSLIQNTLAVDVTNITGTIPVLKGGTGSTTAVAALTSLGAEATANKGAANGYAPLDGTTKISSTYLPSYVDDVLEYANLASFPATGETGKIYVTLDTNKTYRWSGSAYIEIASSPGAAGANTQLQYNNNGVFGASSVLTFNGSKLSVAGQIESTTTGFKFPDGTTQASAATGGGAWEKITANTTATTKKQYVTDTTSAAFTVTLPTNPAAGDYVYFMDAGNWATNNLTVLPSGATIEGSGTNLVLDVKGLMVQLIYDGTTWQVMSNIGPQGPIGPTGPAVGVGKIIAMAMIFGG